MTSYVPQRHRCGWVAMNPLLPGGPVRSTTKSIHSLTEPIDAPPLIPRCGCGIGGAAVHPSIIAVSSEILAVISHSGESAQGTVATDEVIATTGKSIVV